MFYVLLYLLAIVVANLSVATFGVNATILNAFLFIGLDLTARDKLHDAWEHNHLWGKMLALVLFGSVLSYLLSASFVAIASALAFMGAGLVDSVAYHTLRHKSWFIRINGSNVLSGFADSVLFPTIAFGSIIPSVILGQWVAKILGGVMWSWILRR